MQTGADQTALTLPVGRVLFLFEPMMHGLALWRRILVSVIQRHRQNVQRLTGQPGEVQSPKLHALREPSGQVRIAYTLENQDLFFSVDISFE